MSSSTNQRFPVSYGVSSGTSRRGKQVESGADTFISTVAGSVSFASNGFSINPGLEARNLALSKEAQKYDQYEFEALSFRFVRSRAITTTPGMVGIAFDPNPNSASPALLNRFNAYEMRVMGSVYSEITLHVPRDALRGWRFVRCGPNGTDLSIYDVGRLIVATQDEDDTSKVGFVEMHYRIKFKHYHLEPSVPIPHALSLYRLGASQGYATGVAEIVGYDTAQVDGLVVVPTAGVFTLPCGQYLVRATFIAKDTAVETLFASATFEVDAVGVSTTNIGLRSAGVANHQIQGLLETYVVSDGTTTVSLSVTLTGAAGTLAIEQGHITISSLT